MDFMAYQFDKCDSAFVFAKPNLKLLFPADI